MSPRGVPLNVVFFTHLPYALNDQHYLLEAASAAGSKAGYVEWSRGCRIIIDGVIAADFPAGTTIRTVAAKLYDLIGRERTVLIDGMANKVGTPNFLFPLPTSDSVRVYGVFDDYRYDKQGFKLLKFHLVDQLSQLRNKYCWLFSRDLQSRYPDSICVDNASFLTPNAKVRTADPSQVLYVGSIDRRTDLSLLGAIADANTSLHIDIYGTIQKVKADFDLLVAAHPNIHFHGKWDERDFGDILARYRIGLIPYKPNHPMTRYICSSKLYHYLNTGLEVITTPFPQVRRLENYVHILESAADWPRVYEAALTAPRTQAWPYKDFMWQARWHELCAAIEEREHR